MANGQCVRILEDPWISELPLVADTIMFDRFAIILGIKANHFIISFWEWATTRLGTMFYPLTIKSILATLILDRSSEDIVLSHCIAL